MNCSLNFLRDDLNKNTLVCANGSREDWCLFCTEQVFPWSLCRAMELICLRSASHWRGKQPMESCRCPGCAAAVALLSPSPCWPCCCTKHSWPQARAPCQCSCKSNSLRLHWELQGVFPGLFWGGWFRETNFGPMGSTNKAIQLSPPRHRWEWGGGRWAMHVLQSSSPSPLATLSEAPAFHLGRRFLQGL